MIDSGKETIVGVNKYRVPEAKVCAYHSRSEINLLTIIAQIKQGENVEVRQIDNTAVREAQIKKLQHIKQTRDESKVQVLSF